MLSKLRVSKEHFILRRAGQLATQEGRQWHTFAQCLHKHGCGICQRTVSHSSHFESNQSWSGQKVIDRIFPRTL